MVEKLHYNHELLLDRLNDRELYPEKIGFAANDYAIAAWSMGKWWNSETKRAQRSGIVLPSSPPMAAYQSAMEAIANTAKHATYRDALDLRRCKFEIFVADHLNDEFLEAIESDPTGLGPICFMRDHPRNECRWQIQLEMKNGEHIDFALAAWQNLRDWEVATHPIISALEAEAVGGTGSG